MSYVAKSMFSNLDAYRQCLESGSPDCAKICAYWARRFADRLIQGDY